MTFRSLLYPRTTIRVLLFLIFTSCSHHQIDGPYENKKSNEDDIIQASELLLKIYESKFDLIPVCVQDKDNALALLKALDSRLEQVIDDYQAKLDDDKQVQELINVCEQKCNCDYLERIFTDNEIQLNSDQITRLKQIKKNKSMKFCIEKFSLSFCNSKLFQELDKVKDQFKFDEEI